MGFGLFSFGVVVALFATGYAQDLCAGCEMINGAGYNKHPSDCDKFVQCNTNAFHQVVGTVQQCGFGTYYNPEVLGCVYAKDYDCPEEKCNTLAESSTYKAAGNCRGYWKCEESKSIAYCCEKGFTYEEGLGCQENENCTDSCFNDVEEVMECKTKPIPKKPAFYQEYVNGHGWIERPCAGGTFYIHANCSCLGHQEYVQVMKQECKPEIYLPFNKNTNDMSGKNNHITNENVVVEDGSAYFDGNSRLIIPRFTNLENSDSVVIVVKYTSTGTLEAGERRAIVSNSDCHQTPSIMITEDDETVEFGVRTSAEMSYVSATQTKDMDKEIAYVFGDGKLLGMTLEEGNEVEVNGTLRNVHCGLQVGHAGDYKGFQGYVDELTVFLCKPTHF